MSIKIEQVAIGVRAGQANEKVKAIREILGAVDWIHDTVKFSGEVDNDKTECTVANLNFNYDLIPGVEFEIIEFIDGINWHEFRNSNQPDTPFISHLGLHIDDYDEFDEVKNKLLKAGLNIIQEANTFEHSNPKVPDNRKYHYLIFDTLNAFGFDLKLIYRIDTNENTA